VVSWRTESGTETEGTAIREWDVISAAGRPGTGGEAAEVDRKEKVQEVLVENRVS